MNKTSYKQFQRYGLISENLFLLEKEITAILNDLDYETWRNCDIDEEGLKQFQIIMMNLTLPIGQKAVSNFEEESPFQSLRKLLKLYSGLFGKSSLDSEVSNIGAIERDKKIESILKEGFLPKRISPKLRLNLIIIGLWLLFRIQLLTELRCLSSQNMELANRGKTISAFLDKAESASHSSKLQQEWQNNENLLNIAEHINSDINKNEATLSEKEVAKYLDYAYAVNLPQWINFKNTLFTLINHVCIPLYFKKKIIACVRNSVFKLMLQNEYDIRRHYLPSLLNIRFYLPDKVDIRTVLPENFRSGTRTPGTGMNLDLSHTEIVNLYFALKGEYMDAETDIYDFAYALTGYPVDQYQFFKKVVWVSNHKQTLGIFLGMLRSYSTADERSWYWNAAPKYFAYNNRTTTLKPSELSSPFGNFQKHPEIQGADWENMNNIVQKCLKACDK